MMGQASLKLWHFARQRELIEITDLFNKSMSPTKPIASGHGPYRCVLFTWYFQFENIQVHICLWERDRKRGKVYNDVNRKEVHDLEFK